MEIKIKHMDYRILLGVLLILGGILGILEKLNLISNASRIFWTFIFGIAGFAFLYIFATNREHWWSAIPAFSLLGLALTIGLPTKFDMFGGLTFLGGIGLGFIVIYLKNRRNWWAIIPSGVSITLGVISFVSNFAHRQDTGALFFIGLGLTFLLLAILPTGTHTMTWAFIPATILLIFGSLLGTTFKGSLDYIWIAALFLGGISMIWQFLRTQKR
ncbi:MAG: hypothetical protein A2X25_04250 [Chloroflexi bacterium GWB2_49_20]|nr:MAG: hypothetical protein A2X25_04250 [Chloroflexi bacterium GWB2_49_20]OGN77880.1 MAG: hypothetical protein A2X26_01960 [Chloroflexi bacterium GWC2_49_37]OGN82739.1 MAG: hypothetical protein A2X27_09070 [Chloroflexi bacterium GWD2_49_16]HCM96133.1 hypothetical protein [Anaerolineae bacterium]